MQWKERLAHPIVAGIGVLTTVWGIPGMVEDGSGWARWATMSPKLSAFAAGAGSILLLLYLAAKAEGIMRTKNLHGWKWGSAFLVALQAELQDAFRTFATPGFWATCVVAFSFLILVVLVLLGIRGCGSG